MKKSILLQLFLVFIFSSKGQTVDDRTGIYLHFNIDKETFPQNWLNEDINAKGLPLDSSEVQRSLRIINKALAKYPAALIKSNLTKIYVLKSIEFYGIGFGGTYASDVIYIANDGANNGFTDIFIEETFHHEFSSILLRNYPDSVLKMNWLKINPIKYGKGGVQALKDSLDSQAIDSSFNRKGFLHQYATSDFENDFNAFAERLFAPTDQFYKILEKYPKLSQKFNLILAFYQKLAPIFTQEYFTTFNH